MNKKAPAAQDPTPLTAESGSRPNVEARAVDILYKNMPATLAANLILGMLLVFVLWRQVDAALLLKWYLAVACVVGLRALVVGRFRHRRPSPDGSNLWVALASAGSFASGLLWGATALFYGSLDSAPHQVFIMIVLVGLSAGALPTNAIVYPVYVAFVSAAFLPYAALFFYLGFTLVEAARVNLGLGGVALAYMALILLVASATNKQLRGTMALAAEKQTLLDNLDEAKRKLEASNRELESELLERAEIQRNLTQAKEQAEKASKAKTVFLSTMSHEIRTPLNAILGMIDVISDTPLSDPQRNYLKVCRSAGAHLLELINNILDISRIESGGFEIKPRAFLLREFLEKIVDVGRATATSKEIKIELQVAENIPRAIVSDPNALRIVLMNLLGNAVKFTEQGSVILRVDGSHLSNNQYTMNFAVVDSGVGFDADKKDEVLEPFKQIDGSATRQFGGSGLGLSICKALTDMLGGVLLVESEIGKGSTFTVGLTVENVSLDEVDGATESPDSGLHTALSGRESVLDGTTSSIRVLLVDDSVDNRLIVKAFLKEPCFEFLEAENGEIGVELFKKRAVDLVFMDLHMPVMDGLTAVMKIRNWEADNKLVPVPVVVLTADAQEVNLPRMLSGGCTDFLLKPVSKKRLRALVARYVEFPGK